MLTTLSANNEFSGSKMDFLKIIDFFIGICAGGLVALVVLLLPSPPNMFVAMILGGLTGMVLVLPLKILLMPFVGAFEVMIPLGIIGMGVGMTAAMLCTVPAVSDSMIIAWGNLVGLAVSSLIYRSNKILTSQ
jgi:hypothetical protein